MISEHQVCALMCVSVKMPGLASQLYSTCTLIYHPALCKHIPFSPHTQFIIPNIDLLLQSNFLPSGHLLTITEGSMFPNRLGTAYSLVDFWENLNPLHYFWSFLCGWEWVLIPDPGFPFAPLFLINISAHPLSHLVGPCK